MIYIKQNKTMTKDKIIEALELQSHNLDLLINGDYKHDSVLARYYIRLKMFINDLEQEDRI